MTNFQHTSAEGDDLLVRDLVVDAKNISTAELEQAEEIAVVEPLLRNRLISPSAHVSGVTSPFSYIELTVSEVTRRPYGRR